MWSFRVSSALRLNALQTSKAAPRLIPENQFPDWLARPPFSRGAPGSVIVDKQEQGTAPVTPPWVLKAADGKRLVRLVDVIAHVASAKGLPPKPAAREVHDVLATLSEVEFFCAQPDDYAKPLARDWVFTWQTPPQSNAIRHGFDSWCRGSGPSGLAREGVSSQIAMAEIDAAQAFGFPSPVVSGAPQNETPAERHARLLEWFEEEVAARGKYAAVQRVTDRERLTRPTADRSKVGKDIQKGREERKRAAAWPRPSGN